MKVFCQLPSSKGEMTLSTEPLGRGGEGSVYSVVEHSVPGLPSSETLVAKIYHNKNDRERARKIVSMIRNSPDTDSVAWPLGLVTDSSGQFLGYVMKKLAKQDYKMWAELSHSGQRKSSSLEFDVRYALTAALNFAITLEAIHAAGHRVGDVNESNIFIANDAKVLVVDTDSAQIDDGKGGHFPCEVGKPEFTAAELSHGLLKDQLRTVESDVFGYSVAVYQLLTGGAHPTDGVFKGEGDPPSVTERVREDLYPNLSPNKKLKTVERIPTQAIPSVLREILKRGLSSDPTQRPSLEEFEDALDSVLDNLEQCSKVPQHWYDKRDKRCGWCAHIKNGFPDPWSLTPPKGRKSVSKSQKTLPAVTFDSQGGAQGGGRPGRGPAPSATGQSSTPPQQKNTAKGLSLKKQPQKSITAAATAASTPSDSTPLEEFYIPKRVNMPKHKGKTVLTYADGSSRERPSLSVVADQDGGLAWKCFVNELPEGMRTTWSFKNAIPKWSSVGASAFIAFLVACSWWILTPKILDFFPIRTLPGGPSIIYWFTLASVVTALLGVLVKLAQLLIELGRVKKAATELRVIQKESFPQTATQLLTTAIVYGPLILFFAIFVGLNAALGALMDSNSNRR